MQARWDYSSSTYLHASLLSHPIAVCRQDRTKSASYQNPFQQPSRTRKREQKLLQLIILQPLVSKIREQSGTQLRLTRHSQILQIVQMKANRMLQNRRHNLGRQESNLQELNEMTLEARAILQRNLQMRYAIHSLYINWLEIHHFQESKWCKSQLWHLMCTPGSQFITS